MYCRLDHKNCTSTQSVSVDVIYKGVEDRDSKIILEQGMQSTSPKMILNCLIQHDAGCIDTKGIDRSYTLI